MCCGAFFDFGIWSRSFFNISPGEVVVPLKNLNVSAGDQAPCAPRALISSPFSNLRQRVHFLEYVDWGLPRAFIHWDADGV